MSSDKRSAEVARSLTEQQWLYRNDPIDFIFRQQGNNISGSGGGADKLCLKNGKGYAVEIKNGKSNFPFRHWRSNQREWANYCQLECGVPYYIFLLLGQDQPHWDSDKFNPRKAWLIPAKEFIRIEKLIYSETQQKSLVFKAGKGMSKIIQEKKLDAIHLLERYELEWKKGIWIIDFRHMSEKKE